MGTSNTLVLQAVSLEGAVTTLATVHHARGAIELHTKPRQEVTVAVFGTELGLDDIFTVDLANGTQTKTGTVLYVPTDYHDYRSPDDTLLARATSDRGMHITIQARAEVLAMHVSTFTGAFVFRGWVLR